MDAQVRETVLITLNALAEEQKTGDPAVKAAAQKQITDIWVKKSLMTWVSIHQEL